MSSYFTEEQWLTYTTDGYLRFGKLLSPDGLAQLQQRIDAIMMGEADVDYDAMLMQLDSTTGAYGDAGVQSRGHKGATLNYRKIEQLEQDPVFLRFIQHPAFKQACARVYGGHVPIAVFRSMFMNKPAGQGTKLPWHQDRWTDLDRDPLITIYTALDPATRENGCVQIVPGTHRYGILNTEHGSGFLTDEMVRDQDLEARTQFVELEPGETILLHNWLLHSSDRNHSQQSRRALSVCYMDGRTVSASGHSFPIVFGDGALVPDREAVAG